MMAKSKKALITGNVIYVVQGQVAMQLKGMCGDIIKTAQNGVVTIMRVNGHKVHLPTNMIEILPIEPKGSAFYNEI